MATGLKRSRVFLAAACFAVAALLLAGGGSAQPEVHIIPADEVVLLDPRPASPQGNNDLDCTHDCGDSDGSSDEWAYICELGAYQAWFGFDLSSIPDGEPIGAIRFTALMENYESQEVERSLWYDPGDAWIDAATCPGNLPADELAGTIIQAPDAAGWETFDIDLTQHDWQNDLVDDRVSLMVTGQTDGEHYCGGIYLMESGSMPFITIVTGVPTMPGVGIALLILMLTAAAVLALKL